MASAPQKPPPPETGPLKGGPPTWALALGTGVGLLGLLAVALAPWSLKERAAWGMLAMVYLGTMGAALLLKVRPYRLPVWEDDDEIEVPVSEDPGA